MTFLSALEHFLLYFILLAVPRANRVSSRVRSSRAHACYRVILISYCDSRLARSRYRWHFSNARVRNANESARRIIHNDLSLER